MDIQMRYTHAKLGESDENACHVMDEMLASGMSFWESEDWVKALPFRLTGWAHDGRLVRLRLVSEWLLSECPPEHAELIQMLSNFVDGNFCDVYPGAACRWPASPGLYARFGKLEMAAIASDQLTHDWCDLKIAKLTTR